MPRVHSAGPLFVQVINLPVNWGKKICVRGWTQEIEPPFRTAEPFLIRLPKYRALAIGRWSGKRTEEEALTRALEKRDVDYADFTEEAGWVDPDTYREEGGVAVDPRSDRMDRDVDVHDRKASQPVV